MKNWLGVTLSQIQMSRREEGVKIACGLLYRGIIKHDFVGTDVNNATVNI